MTPDQLKGVLARHDDWLNGRDGGSRANLRYSDLSGSDLRNSDLRYSDLSGSYLSGSDLSDSDLSGSNLSGSDLSDSDLSGSKGLPSATDWLTCLEHTDEGYIAYKTFGGEYGAPAYWTVKPGSIITEACNPDRGTVCGCGINLAPIEWVRQNYPGKPIWKCLIRWEWAAGIVVPFGTNGKFRCEKCELVEVVAL